MSLGCSLGPDWYNLLVDVTLNEWFMLSIPANLQSGHSVDGGPQDSGKTSRLWWVSEGKGIGLGVRWAETPIVPEETYMYEASVRVLFVSVAACFPAVH